MKSSIMHPILKSVLALYCALALCACATSTQKEVRQKEELAKLHYQIGIDALHKGNLPKAFDELMTSCTQRGRKASTSSLKLLPIMKMKDLTTTPWQASSPLLQKKSNLI